MTRAVPAARPADGSALLAPAVGYALAAARAVTPESLSRPTPCRGWDLRALLRHASESMAALHEGIGAGCVRLYPSAEDGDLAADPAGALRDRAEPLLDAWASPGRQFEVIDIGGCPIAAGVMAAAGALEIAVHGWDISRACGHRQPIPHTLATELLRIAPMLVPAAGRQPLFAAPVIVAPTAGPSDRLAAYLGRYPGA